jgi:hypothetical protein
MREIGNRVWFSIEKLYSTKRRRMDDVSNKADEDEVHDKTDEEDISESCKI